MADLNDTEKLMRNAGLVALLMMVFGSSAVWAQGLPLKNCPGQTGQFYVCQNDIVVADANAGHGILAGGPWKSTAGALLLIDPVSGAQTIISQAGLLQETVGVVVEDSGTLVAADRISGLVRVNPADGSQTLLSSANPLVNDYFGITKDAGGNFVVTDTGWDPTTPYPGRVPLYQPGRVLLIDKSSGAVSVLAQGSPIAHPFGVTADPTDTSIVVSDMSAYDNQGAIFRIPSGGGNPATVWGPAGTGLVVQQEGVNCPMGVTVEPTGNILATIFNVQTGAYGCSQAGGSGGAIFRVNLGTNTKDDFTTPNTIDQFGHNFGWLTWPFGITVEATRNVLLVDQYYGGIYRLDPTTHYFVVCTTCASAIWDSGEVLSGGTNNTSIQTTPPNLLVSPVGISYARFQPAATVVVPLPPNVSITGAPAGSPEGTPIALSSSVAPSTPSSGTYTYAWKVTKTRKDTITTFAMGSAPGLNFTPDDDGVYMVSLNVTGNGATGTARVDIPVTNLGPAASIMGPSSGPQGKAITLTSVVSSPAAADSAGGYLYTWTVLTNGSSFASGSSASLTFTPNHAGTYSVTLTAADKDGASATVTRTISVTNVAPVITSVTGPASAQLSGSTIGITANFTDAGTADTHTVTFTWGDGTSGDGTVNEANGSGSSTGTHTYTTDGVYEVLVAVTDDGGVTASSVFQFVVVFDPTEGYVQGVGSFKSGTDTPHFGFYVRYANGNLVPSGTNAFKFARAGIKFQATAFEWLAISGANAQFRGSGTINGTGNYEFQAAITDGQHSGTDEYRIQLVDNSTGSIVYDNMMGSPVDMSPATHQAISTGRVVVFVNTSPSVASLSLAPKTVNAGGQATLTGTFADPDTGQTHTVTIDWGDGTPNTKIFVAAGFSFSAMHAFNTATATINVTVADNFGATGTGRIAATSGP
jgi:hypothetical protein